MFIAIGLLLRIALFCRLSLSNHWTLNRPLISENQKWRNCTPAFGLPTGGRGGSPSTFMKLEVWERWISITGGTGTVSQELCSLASSGTLTTDDLEIWVRGHSRSLKLVCTIWKHSFLFAFHSNYGSILYHFRDNARYRPRDFFHPPLHSTPQSASEYCHTVPEN